MHEITRVRHELRRRELVVIRKEQVTPGMLRVILGGDELQGFTSPGADDHIKLFVPAANGETERRDYTPRSFDAETGELAIEFALHDAGSATEWARNVRPGDRAEIGGPRGSALIPSDFDWFLLIGDETALPAIARRIEELPADFPVTSLVAVANAAEEQTFAAKSDHRAIWVHRPAEAAADPAPLLEALATLSLPAGDGFVWIAAEAGVARKIRSHIVEVAGHSPQWLKASGYWVKGQADAHEKF